MSIAIFLAKGFEEIEALTVVDICRRLDITIDMVSLTDELSVEGGHGIKVQADKCFSGIDCDSYEMLLLPGGGEGTKHLEEHEALMAQIDAFYAKGKYIGAICAAPRIFGHKGILKGRKACCYPDFESHLDGAQVVREAAVTDGHVVTSRGMGTAVEFGLAVAELFVGKERTDALARQIVYR